MKKGRKIVMQVSISVADTFADFLLSRKAKGLSEKTPKRKESRRNQNKSRQDS